jgi:hypothetical protein
MIWILGGGLLSLSTASLFLALGLIKAVKAL